MMKRPYLIYVLCIWAGTLTAQDILSATIVDLKKKEPVPFASVYVTNRLHTSYHGTITDQNGRFQLQFVKESDTIRISCVGYITKTLTGKSFIAVDTILLHEDVSMLPQFIVRSVSAKDYIKACIEKIPQNYTGKRFINYGTFWQSLTVSDVYQYFSQSSIVMNSLFQPESISTTVQLNPKIRLYGDTIPGIIPVYRNPKSILYFDLIRTGPSILSANELDNWEFSYSLLSSESMVVIEATNRGNLGDFVFYILPDSKAFRKIEYMYKWPPIKKIRLSENRAGLPYHTGDSLVYAVVSIKGEIQYEKTFEKYNLKYLWNEISYEGLSNMNDLRFPIKSKPCLLVTELVVTDSYEYEFAEKYSVLQYEGNPHVVNEREYETAKKALILRRVSARDSAANQIKIPHQRHPFRER